MICVQSGFQLNELLKLDLISFSNLFETVEKVNMETRRANLMDQAIIKGLEGKSGDMLFKDRMEDYSEFDDREGRRDSASAASEIVSFMGALNSGRSIG